MTKCNIILTEYLISEQNLVVEISHALTFVHPNHLHKTGVVTHDAPSAHLHQNLCFDVFESIRWPSSYFEILPLFITVEKNLQVNWFVHVYLWKEL